MNRRLAMIVFVAAAALAACGGGGGTSAGGGGGGGGIPAPVPTATPAPTTAPVGNLPLSEAVGGSSGWVDPSSHRTLYYLDVDTATGGTCSQASGCLGLWPAFVPVSGSQSGENMTIITRADGTGLQWAYQGHPLYRYAGDSGPDQTNGDNIPDFGGHWHVARSVAPTPPPGGGSDPCKGAYC